ncbi:type II secretion system protein GspG [Lysobacter tyrosinilyticus]
MRKIFSVPIFGVVGLFAILAMARLFGGSHDDAATYTRSYAKYLADKIELFREDNGRLPRTLAELEDPKAPGPYAKGLEDRGQRQFYYRQVPGDCGYVLFSLGADGRLGGFGQDKDIAVECPTDGR